MCALGGNTDKNSRHKFERMEDWFHVFKITCKNYRNIAITSRCSLLYGRVISNQVEEQYGGCKAEGLNQIIEKKISTGRVYYIFWWKIFGKF